MMRITLEQLRAANAMGGVAEVTLKAEGGSFFVRMTPLRGDDRLLVKTRGHQPRAFANPAKAIAVLHDIGILSARLDMADWLPGQAPPRNRRPDRAEVMRRTREVLEHDAWFRAEVEQGLREAKQLNGPRVPHEDVVARWQTKRAELLKRAGASET